MEDQPILQEETRNKYLVYTSAGDNASIRWWLQGSRNFDLWVTYYGEHQGKYRDVATIYNARKGGKFPNLHHAYKVGRDMFRRYQAVMVMDDDIVISGTAISRLFEILEERQLWILQPAFDPMGKVSIPITCIDPRYRIRYTNFVEVTCPLFRTDKLEQFMGVYDPKLIGWGCDSWFLDVLRSTSKKKIAIVDEIPCLNPLDREKQGGREIDKLQKEAERIRVWQEVQNKYEIRTYPHRGYGGIRRRMTFGLHVYSSAVWFRMQARAIHKARLKEGRIGISAGFLGLYLIAKALHWLAGLFSSANIPSYRTRGP